MLCGKLLNMSKGREMITSYIISFFINGVYQLIVLYMMGPLIPIKHFSQAAARLRHQKYRQPSQHAPVSG